MGYRTKRPSASHRGYDRLAPFYSTIERVVFGHQLQRARVELLDELPSWSHLLIFGDGDGRLLEQLCRRQPHSGQITSVDYSSEMLDRQRSRLRDISMEAHVRFIHGDAREYAPEPGCYDTIVAAFFLDCFDPGELSKCLPSWLAGLGERSVLYYVDFVSPAKRKTCSAVLLWAMHAFFRWTTGLPNRRLIDIQPYLNKYGLEMTHERVTGGMIATRIYRVHGSAPGDENAIK